MAVDASVQQPIDKPGDELAALRRRIAELEAREAEYRQAEAALRYSETRFRALIENISDVIVLIDAQGQVTYTSPAITAITGFTPAERRGKSSLELIHPDDRAPMARAFDLLIQQPGSQVNLRMRVQHKDGSWRWIETIATNMLAEPGIEAVVVNHRDVTSRVEAEAEINRRNRDLKILNQVIAASAAGLPGEAILEIACRELAQALALPQALAVLIDEPGNGVTVVAEYRAEGRPVLVGQAISLLDQAGASVRMHLAGPLVIADARTDERLGPLQALARQVEATTVLILPLIVEAEAIGSLALLADLSHSFSAGDIDLAWQVARQVAGALAQARLATTQRRLTAAVEQSDDSVIIADDRGIVLYVNPAFEQVSGYSRSEILGRNIRLIRSDQHDEAFHQAIWQTIRAGQVWRGHLVNRKKNGDLYTDDITITPLRNASGVIVTYVSVQRDITHQLRLEEQLRQAQKMEAIGQMAGGIAHDFNNIILAIMSYTDMALLNLAPDSPVWPELQQVHQNAQRAAALTQQLLAFSRHQNSQPEILNLNDLVINLTPLLRRLIGEPIELVLQLDPGAIWTKVDPHQAEQVLINLAINARDAMPDGGPLTITTATTMLPPGAEPNLPPGRYVVLAVGDSGQGMTAEVKARIFEPFFTTKAAGRGTGLGLAICFNNVKQHGGAISVTSQPGQGAVFTVHLSWVVPAGQPDRPAAPVTSLSPGRETILLVEDEPSVREPAARVLRRQGYTVLEAASGSEALQQAEAGFGQADGLDLLITDVVMPRMSGYELARRLWVTWPRLKVLLISGYSPDGTAEMSALENGAAFLQKPFRLDALVSRVRELLDE